MKSVRTGRVRAHVWLLAAAIVVAGAALLGGLRLLLGGGTTGASEPAARIVSAGAAEPRSNPRPDPARRRLTVRPLPARAAAGERGAKAPLPDPAPGVEPHEAEAPPGDEPTGIALFPAPGTDPPKSGIIVPDDFELPPGYVRHYQVTDDGRPLPAILMFHPDFDFVDENGAPIAVPEDRVVPAELAPPGLGADMLEVPPAPIPMIEPAAEAEPQG